MKPKVSIIAAISRKNRGLGKDNRLLWKITEDMKRFRQVTDGHPVIMGRLTFESIGKPLKGRENIIVTRNPDYKAKGVIVCSSLEEAIWKAKLFDDREIFIIGGGKIYQKGMDYADKLYLTVVEGDYEADTFFPDYSGFSKIVLEKKSSEGKYEYTFLELERDV